LCPNNGRDAWLDNESVVRNTKCYTRSMRILMTGATGFLGAYLLARLLQQSKPYEVTILKRSSSDLGRIAHLLPQIESFDLDRQPLEKAFQSAKYEVVLHCATNYGRGQIARAHIIEPNLLLPLRLLDFAAEHGTRIFINTDTLLDKNISDYSLSKQQFREWLRRAPSHMTCIDMLLEHFYGPGDDQTKFVAGLVRALVDEKAEIALTEGMQTRDFIYIDDVAAAFLHILRSPDHPSGYVEYEVGSGHPTLLRDFIELARTLCANTTTHLHYGALPYRPNEPMKVVANISRLQALGWNSRWSLRAGLEATIQSERTMAGRTARPQLAIPVFPGTADEYLPIRTRRDG